MLNHETFLPRDQSKEELSLIDLFENAIEIDHKSPENNSPRSSLSRHAEVFENRNVRVWGSDSYTDYLCAK
jgi:hypothetical protein